METYTFCREATGIGKNRVLKKIRRLWKTMFNEEVHENFLHQIVKRWTNQRG
jgi:hypothetical protein